MMFRYWPSTPVVILGLLGMVALLSAGCSGDGNDAKAKAKRRSAAHLVEVVPASLENLRLTADREGTLRALREVKVFNQEEGRITKVIVREGDRIRKGSVLIRLDDALLRAEHDKAVATLKQEELNIQRHKKLHDKKLVSDETLTRAQTALAVAAAQERALKTRLDYMTLRAPFDGTVAAVMIKDGDVAPKHTHLMTVIDPSSLVTDVQISELVLPQVKLGDRAEVRIDALGDKVFVGEISRVYPAVDPKTRRGQIEVTLKPVPARARPGLFCRVSLFGDSAEQLVIPQAALRRDARGEYVFVYMPDEKGEGTGKVRRADISTGTRVADRIEVRDGLKRGEAVVAKGFIGLSEGMTVRPVNLPGQTPDKRGKKKKKDADA